ncbi:MAG: Rne/Rng family ribonuclease [Neisseriaceae bacterium]
MSHPGLVLANKLEAPIETILVSVMPQETKVAFYEESELCEFQLERDFSHSTLGNIYIGRVKRILAGLQSAFVEIGLERTAFLQYVDLVENKISAKDQEPFPIESLLHEGQSILVQVIKEPIANKGARLSTQISLVGRYLVFLPQDQGVAVSQRIEDEIQKESLKQLLSSMIPAGHGGGYIVRTRAMEATQQELQFDLDFLDQLWAKIQRKARSQKTPSLLFKDLDLSLRLLRDHVGENTQAILVDSLSTVQRMQAFSGHYGAGLTDKIIYFEEDHTPLLERYHTEEKLSKAFYPTVRLKAGGYIVIESTESLTTIDVNTGGFVGVNNFQQTILQTNLEACSVIARQLRLRNLGGIIIIDFIDMQDEEDQQEVLQRLAYFLKLDKTKITLHGFTALGLVELTRKRTKNSLKALLMHRCPSCGGYGCVKSTQTICYEIMQLIYKEVSRFRYPAVKLLASTEVVKSFLQQESKPLLTLSEALGVEITLIAKDTFDRGCYKVLPE